MYVLETTSDEERDYATVNTTRLAHLEKEALAVATVQASHALFEDGIESLYLKLCDEIGSDPVTDRTIHDRISQLRQKGFVEAEKRNDGISGGSYYLYDLRITPNMVDEALDLH